MDTIVESVDINVNKEARAGRAAMIPNVVLAYNVDPLFFAIMAVSVAVFFVIWVVHMMSLAKQFIKGERRQMFSLLIWTIVPALFIAGFIWFGPQVVDHMQQVAVILKTNG